MADFSPAYRQLLAFLESLSYTEFRTVTYSLVQGLLQEAGVASEQEGYILDVPPYTTPALDLRFQVVQATGHVNEVRLTFTAQEQLTDFHLRTSHGR
jgi:hypothetical protein